MTPAPEEGALRAPPKAVFCIAGTSSGVGKSSMVVGIAAALRQAPGLGM
jgi:Mrp family chromosome partitioning ATPase